MDLSNEVSRLYLEIETLAIKHHFQDILEDMPITTEAELVGVLEFLRRFDLKEDWR